ncbi:unnamed protein product [Ilex paraguariensis]|uniref:Peptidase S1 domain-containing protein n=1 Tax=Ilex paraguariensis TaxID=185542 RepID=A0ABC8UCS6_9AQUA
MGIPTYPNSSICVAMGWGIIDRPYGSTLDSKRSDLDRVLNVNVVGSFLGAKHAARVTRELHLAFRCCDIHNKWTYDRGIRSSTVAMANLKGKILRVDDVAKTALYLASDDAGYIGELNLVVNGGYTVGNPTMMKAMGLLKLFGK